MSKFILSIILLTYFLTGFSQVEDYTGKTLIQVRVDCESKGYILFKDTNNEITAFQNGKKVSYLFLKTVCFGYVVDQSLNELAFELRLNKELGYINIGSQYVKCQGKDSVKADVLYKSYPEHNKEFIQYIMPSSYFNCGSVSTFGIYFIDAIIFKTLQE